jgi:NhaA family Na+:H+ antiporter
VPGSLVGELLLDDPGKASLMEHPLADQPTWLGSDRRLARFLARPVVRFLQVEAAGGLLLLAATVIALLWANSPWSGSYDAFWHTAIRVEVGSFHIEEDLAHWVNDGLMAVFFFVIGLEIKTELTDGQLATARDAALPVIAALGGMIFAALLFTAVNAGGPGASGWGIPMATDIAFAVGVLALLGDRVPQGLKVLLLGLAIADDIGAIVVIAVFYSEGIGLGWLLAAVGGLALVVVLRRAQVWYTPAYVLLGVGVWLCMLKSGVHATIAGVALGLLAPARPLLGQPDADRIAGDLSADADVTVEDVKRVGFELRGSISPAERFADTLHPWSSYLIVPLFALANAGIHLSADTLAETVRSPVTIGVIVGLVAGKLTGITVFSWMAVRSGVARLPDAVTWRHLTGMAMLAGIGFTVSIFIAGLAFDAPSSVDHAKIGILVGSTIAAVCGALVLRRGTGQAGRG